MCFRFWHIADIGVTRDQRQPSHAKAADQLRRIGFVDIRIEDRNEWYQDYSKCEVERMAGEDRHHFDQLLGKDKTNDWIEGTRLKSHAVAQGQLRPGHLRARKP